MSSSIKQKLFENHYINCTNIDCKIKNCSETRKKIQVSKMMKEGPTETKKILKRKRNEITDERNLIFIEEKYLKEKIQLIPKEKFNETYKEIIKFNRKKKVHNFHKVENKSHLDAFIENLKTIDAIKSSAFRDINNYFISGTHPDFFEKTYDQIIKELNLM
jgi:ABC-type antimicrobial peptide transport system ATPase subunit